VFAKCGVSVYTESGWVQQLRFLPADWPTDTVGY
jgi:hypothetical protein